MSLKSENESVTSTSYRIYTVFIVFIIKIQGVANRLAQNPVPLVCYSFYSFGPFMAHGYSSTPPRHSYNLIEQQ